MKAKNLRPVFSIVVPTIRYSVLLDETIESALAVECSSLEILVNCNPWDESFLKSKFINHPNVKWGKNSGSRLAIGESVNNSVNKSTGRWIFILPDDDLISPNIFCDVDFDNLSDDTLVTFGLNMMDLSGKMLGKGNLHDTSVMSQEEAIEIFCKCKFHHHLSLFIFSRNLWNKVGGLTPIGYPNGSYEDTIHHGKLINSAKDGVIAINEIRFTRRISTLQESSRFYINPILVRRCLSNVSKELFALDSIRTKLMDIYGDRENFERFLKSERLRIDMMKLKEHYAAPPSKCLRHAIMAVLWGIKTSVALNIWKNLFPKSFLSKVLRGHNIFVHIGSK